MYQMEKLLHKGKVRSLHRAIVGDQRMPDDEFREGRARISEFQDALKIVERTVNKFTAAGALFNDVNDDLSSEMKKFFPNSDLEDSTIESLGRMRKALESVSPLHGVLRMRLDSLMARHAEIDEKLKARDRLYWEKNHYEEKVAKWTDEEKADVEKVDRNVKKRSKAITEFAEAEQGTLREAKLFVSSIDETLDSLLSLYARFVSQYWSGWSKTLESQSDDSNSF